MIHCYDKAWPNPALTPLPPLPQAAESPPAGDQPPTTDALNQRTPMQTPMTTLGQGDDFEWLLLL